MGYINYKDIKITPVLNDELSEFCKNNGITEEDIEKISKNEMSKNKQKSEINPIVHTYGIKESTESIEEVYVKDIVGFEPITASINLIDTLNSAYSNTAYGERHDIKEKLQSSKDKMIEEIKESTNHELIDLNYISEGQYVLSVNGCHRISMLRFLYIDEVLKKEKPIEEINEKYKIKASVIRYDLTLTYMNYLLSSFGIVRSIRQEHPNVDSYVIKYLNGEERAFSREAISTSFGEIIEQNKINIDDYNLSRVNSFANDIPSLKGFMKTYTPDLLKTNELNL